jgi:hypothetical protein
MVRSRPRHTVYPQQTATMERSLDENEYAQPRFGLEIFSLFAGIGLVLVAVGVYTVISYTVSQQNREIGIRPALGAPRGSIFRFVIVGGLRYILNLSLRAAQTDILSRKCRIVSCFFWPSSARRY